MKRFNIRVYGVCINERNELLLSDETYLGRNFTKFPGGGLEWGEGMTDCLHREFLEEFGLPISVGELFYLTDYFQQSAFSEHDQIISAYYSISLSESTENLLPKGDKGETLRWVPLPELTPETVTFPIDRTVVKRLLEQQ